MTKGNIKKGTVMLCKVLLFSLSFWICCSTQAMEEGDFAMADRSKTDSKVTSFSAVQHLPQDMIMSVFSFINYPALGKARRVCKAWHTLVTEQLPINQRYTLKLIQQFSKGFQEFEAMFLTFLPGLPLERTALDDMIDELQEDREINKEQAYQALLDTKLMQSCPGIEIGINVDRNLLTEKEIKFPYILPSLVKQLVQESGNQKIKIKIKRIKEDIIQLFGLKNLPIGFPGKVTELRLKGLHLKRIPKQIHRLSELCHLTLSDNELSTLPSEIGQLTNLQYLSLHTNELSSIPAEIGLLTNLKELDLYSNQLSSIPAEIGQLTKLRELYLYDNQLSSLPTEIKKLADLRELYLSNNQLSSIPAEVGRLTNLQWLGITNNQLSSIPVEIEEALPKCYIAI